MSEKITMFELLNERLTEEEIIKLTSSYDNKFSELERENILLKNQLQQKENSIKEVREYIEKYINRDFFDLEHSGEVTIKLEIKGLLEILDKGETK